MIVNAAPADRMWVTRSECLAPAHSANVSEGRDRMTPTRVHRMDARTLERFLAKFVAEPDACWEWRAAKHPQGHGSFRIHRVTHPAHRVSYEHFVGPVPDGLSIHHLCENPGCVNPAHLQPVTAAQHTRLHMRTHCKHGHEFTPENIYRISTLPGKRVCRTCTLARVRARDAKRTDR